MHSRRTRRVLAGLALVVALFVVVLFATGRLSYVATHGTSMLPGFHSGDLVILRAGGPYHVGEIAAYHSSVLHTTVLHRIVSEQSGLFSFKGDNNTFLDPERVGASALMGTVFLHIPRGGLYLAWVRQPLHFALIGLVFLFLSGCLFVRRRRAGEDVGRGAAPLPHLGGLSLRIVGSVVGLAALGVVSFAAFQTPSTHDSNVSVPYGEAVSFSYYGSAAPGAVYPTGRVASPEPIFVKLVHSLAIKTTYHLKTTAPAKLRGTISLEATVVDPSGWTHLLVRSAPVPFSGSSASVAVPVHLPQAVALIKLAAQETGIPLSEDMLVLAPHVLVHGTVGGVGFKDSLAPSVTLQMSPLELDLLSMTTSPGAPEYPQLRSSSSGSLTHHLLVAGTPTLFGRRSSLHANHVIGLASVALAVLLCGVLGRELWRRRAVGEEERSRRRVRHDLVPVETDPAGVLQAVVDVSTMTALADLAERFDVVVLDYEWGEEHTYFAKIGDVLYRYRHGAKPPQQPEAEVLHLADPPWYVAAAGMD